MNSSLFYQLLDRDLPAVINGATSILADNKDRFSGSAFLDREEANSSTDSRSAPKAWDPLSGHRGEPLHNSVRLGKQKAVRRHLGQLSLAYAISEYEPFATLAEDLISRELVGTDLLFRKEWEPTFSFKKVDRDLLAEKLSVVEIVLSMELLRGLGVFSERLLGEVRNVLGLRLDKVTRADYLKLSTECRFASVLEMVVLALFLNRAQAIELGLDRFRSSLVGHLQDAFETWDLDGRTSTEAFDSQFCIDCYFAIGHWLSCGPGSVSSLVDFEFDRFRNKFARRNFDQIFRGIWARKENAGTCEDWLKESAVLLVQSSGFQFWELLNCSAYAQIQNRNRFKSTNPIITQPLLWFGSDNWNYHPFADHSGARTPFMSRRF